MDIAQTAKRTGIPAHTLRYYERMGLITSLGRVGARRVFAPAVVEQLALISLGQSAGLSLDEIKSMFTRDGMPRIDRTLLKDKARQLDQLIVQLRSMSRGLRHAAACPAKNHVECPTFQKLLKQAATGGLGRGLKRMDVPQTAKARGKLRRPAH